MLFLEVVCEFELRLRNHGEIVQGAIPLRSQCGDKQKAQKVVGQADDKLTFGVDSSLIVVRSRARGDVG